MPELNSPFFDFHCDPGQGSFSLIPHSAELPGVENARLEVVYLAAGKPLRWLADAWPVETASETDSLISAQGGSVPCGLRSLPTRTAWPPA